MDDIFSGPYPMLMRIDGESGAVKAKTLFGGTKGDAIKDVKLLPNGTLLVASNEDCDYPDLDNSGDFVLHVYAIQTLATAQNRKNPPHECLDVH